LLPTHRVPIVSPNLVDRSKQLTILALLVLAVGINYIDRGSLSVAKPDMAREFNLNPTQMGWLFSAFFWSYAVFQLVAGWLVDRYDSKIVYAIGFCIWSLATIAVGIFSNFALFFALRLLLGIGESVSYPATSRILADHFPEERRGFANALVDAGSKIGPALSTLVGGLVVAKFGWRSLFLAVGIGSLLWLIPWLVLVPAQRKPTVADNSVSSIGLGELCTRREVWGTSLGMFCLGYVWYFLVSWLPSYLVEERGFSKETMAVLGSLPFWAMAVSSLSGGWLSDRWIRSGASPTRVRKHVFNCGSRIVRCVYFSGGGGKGRANVRLVPHRRVHFTWPLHVERMGGDADPGRTRSRREMDWTPKCHRQSWRCGFTCVDGMDRN
jgi:MFS family permease